MKTSVTKVMAVVMGIALVCFAISCASTGSQSKRAAAAPQTQGFLDGYYQDLQPGPEGGAKMRWLKTGVDFGQYNKIMLDSVIFYFADDSENKGIDARGPLERHRLRLVGGRPSSSRSLRSAQFRKRFPVSRSRHANS
jgi:hypothetical protein